MASRQVFVNELVTVDDIARRYGMSQGQVCNLVTGREGRRKDKFPQPIAGKGTRAVWLLPDVEEWYSRVLPQQSEAEKRAARNVRKRKRNYEPLSA